MKQLIAGLALGLGLLHGAQADTQTQTVDFIIPADSVGYTGSKTWAAFDSSLGNLQGVEFSYNFSTQFSYSVTNNGNTAINPVSLSALDGSVSFFHSTADGMQTWQQSQAISGSTSFFLAPGQTATESTSTAMPAGAKGMDLLPPHLFMSPMPMMMPMMVANSLTTYYEITTPYLSVGARNLRNLSVDATAQDVQGSLSLTYIYAATAPVPEPESYAMFLAGLGLIGAMVRRRKMQ